MLCSHSHKRFLALWGALVGLELGPHSVAVSRSLLSLWFCSSPGEQRDLGRERALISLNRHYSLRGKGLCEILMFIFPLWAKGHKFTLSPEFTAVKSSYGQGHKNQKSHLV